jgi:hypothetical protein
LGGTPFHTEGDANFSKADISNEYEHSEKGPDIQVKRILRIKKLLGEDQCKI